MCIRDSLTLAITPVIAVTNEKFPEIASLEPGVVYKIPIGDTPWFVELHNTEPSVVIADSAVAAVPLTGKLESAVVRSTVPSCFIKPKVRGIFGLAVVLYTVPVAALAA